MIDPEPLLSTETWGICVGAMFELLGSGYRSGQQRRDQILRGARLDRFRYGISAPVKVS